MPNSTNQHPTTHWVMGIVQSLVNAGIQHICIGSGSRSAPLTRCIAHHTHIKSVCFYDERALGFVALGIAKATQTPVGIVTTSGSAGANVLPAVVEAHQSGHCLVVITADRPPELHGIGANQTMPQSGLFAHFAQPTLSIACPSPQVSITHVQTRIQTHIATGCTQTTPVHINIAFRDLAVNPSEAQTRAPQPVCLGKGTHPDWSQVPPPGLIIVGQLRSIADAQAVQHYLSTQTAPVIADITSMLRTHYPRSKQPIPTQKPILLVGGRVTTQSSLNQLAHVQKNPHCHVRYRNHPFNPYHAKQTILEVDCFAH
ncbi:hypothetical protein CL648_05195 [bacterium]|nr:hypothetical protein [bacterium]